MAELDRVRVYPQLLRYYTEEERTRFLALVMALSEVVDLPISSGEETSVPRICLDPDDQVIACTVVGEADVTVSGDDDLLALERVTGIPIRTAARFLELLE